MKRFLQFGLFFTVLTSLLFACSPAAVNVQENPSGVTDQSIFLPNVLVQSEGEVRLRRVGWLDFIPVPFGTVVSPGDLIRVAAGGQATVFCGAVDEWTNGALALASDGAEHGIPCQSGRPPRPWADVAALRGDDGGDLPYVIAPRGSAVLSNRPNLAWHPLTHAASYDVTLAADDNLERKPVSTGETQILWPADWPSLQPGSSYVLVVAAGQSRSDGGPDGNTGLGFWLLPEKESAALREQEARLRGAGLTTDATQLLIAELYLRAGLVSDAAALYRSLAGSQASPAVQVALGQAYLQIGLANEAGLAFNAGLEAARAGGQREVEGAALVGSALALRLLHDEPAAKQALLDARAVYAAIGDSAGAAQVDQFLAGP